MFSDHNGIKLEINNREIIEKSPNWWLNNTSKQSMSQRSIKGN